MLVLAPACGTAQAAEATKEVTLPADTTVSVDLLGAQREAERAEALRRARDAAALPGAAQREASVPEILLIQREVLPHFVVVSARPDGPRQTWRVRSVTPPVLYAQRVIPRLLGAGFSSAPGCPGEEWSGTHGGNRVSVRAEQRTVAIHLAPGTEACADGKPPRPL